MRKTKIICTIGPATSGVDNLTKLIECGMDTARLNFSHGSREDHLATINEIREAAKNTRREIAIIQDLQGPKIRTGKVEGGAVELLDGAQFSITSDDVELGNAHRVGTTYKNLIKEIKAGNTILLDDGYIILDVDKVTATDIVTIVRKGGILKNNKGIIAPGVSSTAPSMSDKDIEDLKFGLAAGVDMVALSFVRSERDVMELRTIMKLFGRTVPIIAKIERFEGYEDIVDIINESDAIMVARGDLGLEMPAEDVPVVQKEIISKCNFYGKPVITATQMLESMISNPRPTRAEASDVANAVIDGTDCVMLSGETSIGAFPFDAVKYMDKIIRSTEEKYKSKNKQSYDKVKFISEALGMASCTIAEQIEAKAIITETTTGYTAKNIAKYRPCTPIIAVCTDPSISRSLAIVWGVNAVTRTTSYPIEDGSPAFDKLRKYFPCLVPDSFVVYVAGLSGSQNQPKNQLRIVKG